MKQHRIFKNEKGIAVITALMLLVILTLIGFAATNTTTVETQIAGSEISIKQGFYKADAGVTYAIRNFSEADFNSKTPIWLPITADSNPRKDNPDPNMDDQEASLIERRDVDEDGFVDFALYYLYLVKPSEPMIVEVRSVSLPDKNGHGANVIIDAEMQLPTVVDKDVGPGNLTNH